MRQFAESLRRNDPQSRKIEILGQALPAQEAILSPDALAFVTGLQREFNARRKSLLEGVC